MRLWWLCALIPIAAWWPRGRDLHEKRARLTMIAMLTGFLLASLMPNKWLAAYTALFLIGLFRVPSPCDRLPLTVYPALLCAALYVLLAPQVDISWVRPVLWSIAACGLILSGWWAVSLSIGQGHYDRLFQWKGKTWLHLYEHQPVFNVMPKYCCGQGNENFAQGLAGAATASSMGLVVLGSRWAILSAVLCALPCLKIRGHWRDWPQPTQGWLYLGAIGLAACVTSPGDLVFAGLVASAFILFVWHTYPSFWSGRQEMWAYGVQVWREMRWPGKLIGAGPESWIHIFQRDAENHAARLAKQQAFATHAHNEFVHELVERGALGVLAMSGYLVTTLWALSGAGPEGHALVVMGAFYIACMLVSFPSTLYHEVALMDRGDVTGHGMPILNVVGLALVLLAEGVLR